MAAPTVELTPEQQTAKQFEKAVKIVSRRSKEIRDASIGWLKGEVNERRLMLKLQLGHEDLTDALQTVDTLHRKMNGK